MISSLTFDNNLVSSYRSPSQVIRVLSEGWLADNMYCPCCGNIMLKKFQNNSPVADFYCDECKEQFELKSCENSIKRKIVDGAYNTAIERVNSNTNPNLFVLQYNDLAVKNLIIVPKYFFSPSIIEKRKPLATTARRAGWVGSNILFGDIPEQGKIKIIDNGEILPPETVCAKYTQTKQFLIEEVTKRGWLFDVLNCVNAILSDKFYLDDIYKFAPRLKILHPDNNNIEAKIRQQLQILRDNGVITFLGNGHYQKN